MNAPYNIAALKVPVETSAEEAANEAHLILISAVELANDLVQVIENGPVQRSAFALLYLIESAEKLAGFSDDALQTRALKERKQRAEPTEGAPC